MSLVLNLRQFVCDKLTVVAQEILAAFEKTLEGQEAEIVRQRKMLEMFFSSPEMKQQLSGRCLSGDESGTWPKTEQLILSCVGNL